MPNKKTKKKQNHFASKLLAIATLIGALTAFIQVVRDFINEGTSENTELKNSKYEELTETNEAKAVSFEKTQDKDLVNENKTPQANPAKQDIVLIESPTDKPEQSTTKIDSQKTKPNVNPTNIGEKEQVEPKYKMLRKGYIVAESRYLSFDNNQLRLYTRAADEKSATIQITDNEGNSPLGKNINLGVDTSKEISIEGNTYRIYLLGTDTRIIRSNVGYYNIEKQIK